MGLFDNKLKSMWKILLGGIVAGSILLAHMDVEAATSYQKELCKKEIEQMLYAGNSSVHNFYQYRMTVSEFDKLYNEMKNGECRRIIASYYTNMYFNFTKNGKYIDDIYIANCDAGVLERYENLNRNVDNILAGIEDEMDDLDKVIYLHDELVEFVTYRLGEYQMYGAGGALGDGYAVCSGYAKGLNLLLNEMGLKTAYVRGVTLNHGWTYVNLDGNWYHIDPTWDDTRSPIKGQTSRQFLLKNDAEFSAPGVNSHGEFHVGSAGDPNAPTSTSTLYSDWFMHDVVGKIAFEDGLWYFIDPQTKNLVCADADGSQYEVVVEYSGKNLEVIDVTDSGIRYSEGGIVTEMNMDTVEDDRDDIVSDTTTAVPNTPQSTLATIGILGELNLNDISNWKSGSYCSETGLIMEQQGYICTNGFVECEPKATYSLNMKDSRFRVQVNEYNEKCQLIQSVEMQSGDEITVSSDTKYVTLSVHFYVTSTFSYDDYKTKLSYNLMSVDFELQESQIIEEENTFDSELSEKYLPLVNVNLSDYEKWCEGRYNEAAQVAAQQGYVSTKQCYAVEAGKNYYLEMKDTRFCLVINEYSANNNLIATTQLSSNDIHRMNDNTEYIGISMYMPIWKDITLYDISVKLKYNLHSVSFTQMN